MKRIALSPNGRTPKNQVFSLDCHEELMEMVEPELWFYLGNFPGDAGRFIWLKALNIGHNINSFPLKCDFRFSGERQGVEISIGINCIVADMGAWEDLAQLKSFPFELFPKMMKRKRVKRPSNLLDIGMSLLDFIEYRAAGLFEQAMKIVEISGEVIPSPIFSPWGMEMPGPGMP